MKWLSIHRERPSILWGLGILLLLLSSLYLGKGFYQLAIANFGDGLNLQRNAQDLFARWQEQYYVLQGHYPYFVREGSLHVNFEIGPVKSGGYPPWAFWTALFLVPSWSWPATRLYFTLLNLVALGVVGVFSYRVGAAYGRSQGLLALGSVLAISANTTTLNNGQYGLVLNALLIGMYCLLEQRRGILAGLVLAIAFIKPNVSGFFLFILIAQKRLGALVAFSAYLGFASLAVWRMTGVSPLQMINTVREQSKFFANQGSSGTNLLIKFGIEPQNAIVLLGLVAIAIALGIFYVWSAGSLLTLFATASVLGRVSTYHWFYDNVMLIFLLLGLLKILFEHRRSLDWGLFLLVGVTLWLPRSVISLINDGTKFFDYFQFVVWIVVWMRMLMFEKNSNWPTVSTNN